MKSFKYSYGLLVQKIAAYLLSEKYAGGLFEINDDIFFTDILKKYTSINFSFVKKRLDSSYPQLINASFFYKDEKNKFEFRAGATDYSSLKVDLKAKGELLERLSSCLPYDHICKNSFNVDLLGSDEQQTKLRVKKILNFGYVYLPISAIYWGFRNTYKKNKKEDLPPPQVSTSGCAGHFTYNDAMLSAWLELIQRDGFLVYWLNSISPKKIILDKLGRPFDSDIKKLLRDFEKYNLEYYFLDITSDIGIPTVACALVDRSQGEPTFTVGAAAGFDFEDMIMGSAVEAVSVMSALNEKFVLNENYEPFSEQSIGRIQRLRLYFKSSKSFEYCKFLISSQETISVDDFMQTNKIYMHNFTKTKEKISYLRSLFREKSLTNKTYEVCAYSFHNKLLDYFGYHVVRVMCPALYSLYLNENYANYSHPRLKEFVKNKGFEKIAKLNIWPHPFP